MKKIHLGAVSDVNDGEAKGFDINNTGTDTFFIVRKGNEIFAYLDICPHYNDTSLPWKRHMYLDNQSQHIVCAAHGALFDIEDGYCLQGPCLGERLRKVPIEVSADNEIWIRLTTIEEFKL